jgi:hypothetical protein
MLDGWTMSGNKKDGIKMMKGEHGISFDKTVHTPKGVLFVAVLKQHEIDKSAMVGNGYMKESGKVVAGKTAMVQNLGRAITINKAHDMCGHMGHVEAEEICDHFGQKISKQGNKQCMDCGKAKAKQLAMTQDNQEHVVAGPEAHRVFMDVSSVKHGSDKTMLSSKPYWLLMVVEQVNFKVSEFLSQKKDLPNKVCEMVCNLKQKGVKIKYMWLENAGENKLFAEMAYSHPWNLQLEFEFTGAGTLQRNYLEEVGFGTLWG